MSAIALPSRSSWHAEGLRWIGSLFNAAAARLERAPIASEPRAELLPYEDFISDVRHRVQNRYY